MQYYSTEHLDSSSQPVGICLMLPCNRRRQPKPPGRPQNRPVQATVDDSPGLGTAGRKRGQMMVIFSELRTNKGWFSSAEEEVPWEEWTIVIEAHSKQSVPRATTSQALAQALHRIIVHTSSAHGREIVPAIRTVTNSLSPFPYSIKGKVGGTEI
ncbi:hypothetical protein RHS01_11211 [Rhizoctonia solani]|uniref:Autophagy-related protein 101 n=1 Tax=Rhizoctonia solani TaxID=456999 RepID=A0A8H7M1P9_9AGAM|nr:hypothetical protein RHS01_11211 [Rhizoctonia solani]